MGLELVAVTVYCSAMDLQKTWRLPSGQMPLFLSLFQQGFWFWKAFVFVLKRNVVTVLNHRYLGMVFLHAPTLQRSGLCASHLLSMVRQTGIQPSLLELD